MEKPEDIGVWLTDKTPALSSLIASRAALRCLPIAFIPSQWLPDTRQWAIVVLFRAGAIMRCTWLADDKNLAALSSEAAAAGAMRARGAADTGRADSIATAFYEAALGCGAAARGANAPWVAPDPYQSNWDDLTKAKMYSALGASSAVGYSAYNNVPEQQSIAAAALQDCHWLRDNALDHTRLDRQPLWFDEMPLSIKQAWENFVVNNSGNGTWDHWIEWYKKRLRGCVSEWGLPPSGEREMAVRLIKAESDFWIRGEEQPAELNAALGQWLTELNVDPIAQALLKLEGKFAADAICKSESVEQEATRAEVLAETANAKAVIDSIRFQQIHIRYGKAGHNSVGAQMIEEQLEINSNEDIRRLDRHLNSVEDRLSAIENAVLTKDVDANDLLKQSSRLHRYWLKIPTKMRDAMMGKSGELLFAGAMGVTYSLAVGAPKLLAAIIDFLNLLI